MWIILVAIGSALLLIIILFIVLWCCGAFKKREEDDEATYHKVYLKIIQFFFHFVNFRQL